MPLMGDIGVARIADEGGGRCARRHRQRLLAGMQRFHRCLGFMRDGNTTDMDRDRNRPDAVSIGCERMPVARRLATDSICSDRLGARISPILFVA